MTKNAKIKRSQKEFLKAMKRKFREDPVEHPDPYTTVVRGRGDSRPREADHEISRVTPHPTLLPYRREL